MFRRDDPFLPMRWRHFPLLEEEMTGWDMGGHTGLSISEDKDHVFVEADMPGLKADDIELTFERGTLWIRGEKKEEETNKDKKYYRKALKSFSYRVVVPGAIDEKKEPEADYKDGVIKITFHKTQQGQAKKIKVK